MKLKRNMNRFDQMVRLCVGVASIYVGLFDSSLVAGPVIALCLGIFGIVNLFSVATCHCPIYNMAGINTTARKET